MQYLRVYEQYPQAEMLVKFGLYQYATSKQILRKIGEDKSFRKWLITHRQDVLTKYVYCEKYLSLQLTDTSGFAVVIAKSPAELILEGNLLHHCVGRMGYDQKFAREDSLIFFIRTKEQPDVPFVTIEYSPAQKRILQCYGDHDSKPTEEVINFVHKKWLPYANRKIKQLAA